MFQLLTDSAIHIENTTSLSSINDFFYDDPTMPYTPLQDHELAQSLCYPIIDKKENCFYCRLHPAIRNVHLESIEHHIKYKGPAAYKSALLTCPEITHELTIL